RLIPNPAAAESTDSSTMESPAGSPRDYRFTRIGGAQAPRPTRVGFFTDLCRFEPAPHLAPWRHPGALLHDPPVPDHHKMRDPLHPIAHREFRETLRVHLQDHRPARHLTSK